MDNYFQNIYRPVLRLAEKTDTRAAIQRHQRDWKQSEDDKNTKDKSGRLFGDDVMSVSLAALINLLEDLLKKGERATANAGASQESEDPAEADQAPESKQNKAHSDKPQPAEQANSAAAQAYQHAAETREGEYPAKMSKSANVEQSTGTTGIPAEDIDLERIRSLLDKARKLQEQGYEELQIKDRGDFLKSLEHTVEHTLQG